MCSGGVCCQTRAQSSSVDQISMSTFSRGGQAGSQSSASQSKSGLDIEYNLPETVVAIREGWQWTCTSGAVVSGLLAGVAAQLLSTFKSPGKTLEPQDQDLVLALCYAAIFLNISATISSFILTDNLGGIGYKAANQKDPIARSSGRIEGMTEVDLLRDYGASQQWSLMLIHWLLTFSGGILSLIISVLSFVWLVETRSVAISSSIFVVFTLIPITYFIIGRPFVDLYILKHRT